MSLVTPHPSLAMLATPHLLQGIRYADTHMKANGTNKMTTMVITNNKTAIDSAWGANGITTAPGGSTSARG